MYKDRRKTINNGLGAKFWDADRGDSPWTPSLDLKIPCFLNKI